MMKKDDLLNILNALANKEVYGAHSLAYLPGFLFVKWASDNRDIASKFCDVERIFFEPLSPENIWYKSTKIVECDSPIACEREFIDFEGLFIKERDFPSIDIENPMKYAAGVICTLDLSAGNIAIEDIADAFDAYLDSLSAVSILKEEGKAVAAKLVARLMLHTNMPESRYDVDDDAPAVIDPFCKYGVMLDALPIGYRKAATAESRIYQVITFVRLAFRGKYVEIAPISSIGQPVTDTSGRLKTYPYVVSDISGIRNDTPSTAYQLDIHRRFQNYLPEADSLNEGTAALNALGLADDRDGHCFIVANSFEGSHNTMGVFSRLFMQKTLKEFLAKDWLRAVIAIPSLHADKRDFRRGRLSMTSITLIYAFSKSKPKEIMNKILFVDATACKSECEIIDKVCDVFADEKEVRGFSAVVPLGDIIAQLRPNLSPKSYTSVLEAQKHEDIDKIIREIERLEDRHSAVNTDIRRVSELLTGKEH